MNFGFCCGGLLRVASVVLVPSVSASAASDCPAAASAGKTVFVERSGQVTEVIYVDDHLVRTVFRTSGGDTLLETTTFEGLFDLERIDRGRRTVYRPKANLGSFLPLKVGQDITAVFESGDAPQVAKRKVILRVKRRDELFLESCKYDVFAIERSISVDDAAPVFVDTDYYAPELKLVIAKEFKDPGGTVLNKFDKIYSKPQ